MFEQLIFKVWLRISIENEAEKGDKDEIVPYELIRVRVCYERLYGVSK